MSSAAWYRHDQRKAQRTCPMTASPTSPMLERAILALSSLREASMHKQRADDNKRRSACALPEGRLCGCCSVGHGREALLF